MILVENTGLTCSIPFIQAHHFKNTSCLSDAWLYQVFLMEPKTQCFVPLQLHSPLLPTPSPPPPPPTQAVFQPWLCPPDFTSQSLSLKFGGQKKKQALFVVLPKNVLRFCIFISYLFCSRGIRRKTQRSNLLFYLRKSKVAPTVCLWLSAWLITVGCHWGQHAPFSSQIYI